MEHHTPHFTHPFYAIIVLMLYGVGMMIYRIPQQNKVRGSYLVRKDRNMMLFRKPLPLRRFTLAAAGFGILLFISTLVLASEARNPPPAYVMSVATLSLPVLFLYLSGPSDIRLDGSQRTYERTQGFPWKPVTQFGTFSGIKGVSVSPQNSVQLVLEKPGAVSRGVMLCSTGTKATAEALVEELRQIYGFARVPYSTK